MATDAHCILVPQ